MTKQVVKTFLGVALLSTLMGCLYHGNDRPVANTNPDPHCSAGTTASAAARARLSLQASMSEQDTITVGGWEQHDGIASTEVVAVTGGKSVPDDAVAIYQHQFGDRIWTCARLVPGLNSHEGSYP